MWYFGFLRRTVPLRKHNQSLEQRSLCHSMSYCERPDGCSGDGVTSDETFDKWWKGEPERFWVCQVQRVRDNPIVFYWILQLFIHHLGFLKKAELSLLIACSNPITRMLVSLRWMLTKLSRELSHDFWALSILTACFGHSLFFQLIRLFFETAETDLPWTTTSQLEEKQIGRRYGFFF